MGVNLELGMSFSSSTIAATAAIHQKVHHAEHEEHRHESPATADAQGAVAQSHDDGARVPSRHSLRRNPSGVLH